MSVPSQAHAASLIPAMRYRDLDAAVAWLCATFDFGKDHVVTAEDGRIVFAQLMFGSNLIMLGPVSDSEIDRFMRQPDEIGGAETQSCYLVVQGIEAHRERAVAAGAEVVVELKDFDHGGKGYSCRDPEGHIWNFGTYSPSVHIMQRPTAGSLRRVVLSLVGIAVIGAAVAGALVPGTRMLGRFDAAKPALEPNAPVNLARAAQPVSPSLAVGYGGIAAKYAVVTAGEQLKHKRRLAITNAALRRTRIQVKRLQQAKEGANLTRQQAEEKLLTERRARLNSEEIARGAERQLATERLAKEKAEHALLEMREKLQQAQVVIPPIPKPAVGPKSRPTSSQGRASHRAAAKASEQAADTMPAFIP
jgi:uncharacterized glyoxalase superfamily protein PhnB